MDQLVSSCTLLIGMQFVPFSPFVNPRLPSLVVNPSFLSCSLSIEHWDGALQGWWGRGVMIPHSSAGHSDSCRRLPRWAERRLWLDSLATRREVTGLSGTDHRLKTNRDSLSESIPLSISRCGFVSVRWCECLFRVYQSWRPSTSTIPPSYPAGRRPAGWPEAVAFLSRTCHLDRVFPQPNLSCRLSMSGRLAEVFDRFLYKPPLQNVVPFLWDSAKRQTDLMAPLLLCRPSVFGVFSSLNYVPFF